jgi:hypothetical protein
MVSSAQAQGAKSTGYAFIRCESPGGRYSECPADTRQGVQLVRDLSGRCQMGNSWGYGRNAIWVDRGCAAEFEIGRRGDAGWGWGYEGDNRIVCASENYQRAFCPVQTQMGVRLVNQISNSPCTRGRTWWRDERGIVVSEGCAGEFEVGYRDNPYETPPSTGGGGWVRPDRLVCESRDFKRRYCPADIGYGAATLVRQTSSAQCVYGRSWSYDRRGIWVQDGCAGEFEIGYQDNHWGGAGGSGGSVSGSVVRCESRDYRRSSCAAYSNRGVRLLRQVSKSQCVEGQTWGYDRRSIWVDQGCGGEFEVR